jgi:hypothetical protein
LPSLLIAGRWFHVPGDVVERDPLEHLLLERLQPFVERRARWLNATWASWCKKCEKART